LAALAEEMRISLAEAFEVATFYAHFDVVKDDDAPVPPLTIRVCDSIACQVAVAEALIASLMQDTPPQTRILRAPCVGQCACAPVAVVGRNVLASATANDVRAAVVRQAFDPVETCGVEFEAYRASGGYAQMEKLRPDEALDRIDQSGLRGMGGAGFPA